MKLSLPKKFTTGISVLVVCLTIGGVGMTNFVVAEAIKGTLRKDVLAAQKVFLEFERLRAEELIAKTRMAADVPQLKAVVTTEGIDHATILDAAADVRRLIGSDIFMVVNQGGQLLASVTEPDRHGENIGKWKPVAAALRGEVSYELWLEGSSVRQVAAVPFLFGEEVAGALLTGFTIDYKTINTLKQMTNCRVALIRPGGPAVEVSAGDLFEGVGRDIKEGRIKESTGAFVKSFYGERYMVLAAPLAGSEAWYVLGRSLDQEFLSYFTLQKILYAVALGALLLALLLEGFISARIARPLRVLVQSTERIARGDFTSRVDVSSKDEVGELARAFNVMAENLQETMNERKQTEEALRQSEEHNRLVLETANDAFISIDARSVVIDWNRQAEKSFGWSRGEIIGKTLAEMVIPFQYRENAVRELGRFLMTGESSLLNKRFESTALHRDGREFPIEITVWPIRIGEAWQFNAFVHDITERKRLERQFLQSQKMEAVGRLAGGVAHDFNNLLTIITGYASLERPGMKADDPIRADFEEILKAGRRAKELIDQLLAFSRRQMIQPKVMDPNQLILNMDKMLHRLIGEDIEVITLPAKDIGRIKADPGQIEQVIVNLVVNARDAMPKGGRLTIETADVTLDEVYVRKHEGAISGDYVMLAVSDTGGGMSEEVKAHIFEPFFTTKEKGKGTGLGLATCYGIVKQSNGYISAYSELNHGTTFKIYLPRVDEAPEAFPKREELETIPPGKETVLLVEDEAGVRAITARVLKAKGYTVLEAADGVEALRVLAGHPEEIHLLITDMVMPRMGGKGLAEKLKAMRPRVRIILTSGYTDNAIAQGGHLGTGDLFIQKPFSPQDLLLKVRQVLDK